MLTRVLSEVFLASIGILVLYAIAGALYADDDTTVSVLIGLLITALFHVLSKFPTEATTTGTTTSLDLPRIAIHQITPLTRLILKLFILLATIWYLVLTSFEAYEVQLAFLVSAKHIAVDPYGDQAIQLVVAGGLGFLVWLPLTGIGTMWITRNCRHQPFHLYFLVVLLSIGLVLLGGFISSLLSGQPVSAAMFVNILQSDASVGHLTWQDKGVFLLYQFVLIIALLTFQAGFMWLSDRLGGIFQRL